MKKYVLALPEIILLGLASFWFLENYISGNHFNSFALAIFTILLFQVIFKNKYVAFAIATIISLFSLYMVLAVFSEFRDFPTVTLEAIQLLAVGLALCSLAFGSAIMMFYKFLPKVF